MLSLACPACGAATVFRSDAPYCVCSYCQSLLVRSDTALEALGKVASVPDDFSPLQMGSHGYFGKQHFTLIGRIRKQWDQGSWSEWFALFDDQRAGWFAEAQGDWMLMFPVSLQNVSGLPKPFVPEQVELEARWRINDKPFSVTDIKPAQFVGAEGELPDRPDNQQSVLSIDLRGPDLQVATVEFSAGRLSIFAGQFVEFSDCKFQQLRSLAGWNAR